MFGLTKKEFLLLEAKPEDYEAIAEIHGLSFPRGWSTSEIMDLALQDSVTLIVARQVGSKSGSVAGFNLIRQAADEAEILSIAVRPKLVKQGLGEKLMREALLRLHGDRINSLFLEVDEENTAAVHLYKKLGFTIVANRPGYYHHDQVGESGKENHPATALVMRLDLV